METRLLRRFSKLYGPRFSLAAFSIPLLIRVIPEIVAGSYPLGWDVMAYFVPNTLDMVAGRMSLWGLITSPPLMYSIVVPVYLLAGSSLFLIFKVLGPVLFGLLAWSLFRFCRVRLFWPEGKALAGVLFASAYFVVLRISWDAFQLELGLSLFLLALSMDLDSRMANVGRAGLLGLAVLSNQLAGVLVVGYAAFTILDGLRKRIVRSSLVQLPALALFGLVAYATTQTSLAPGLTVFGTDLAFPVLAYDVGFLAYAYVFVVPLVVLGFGLFRRRIFWPWVLVCFGGLVLSLLPGHVFQDIGYRWVLMLSVPVLLAAFEGFLRLGSLEVSPGFSRWLRPVRVLVLLGLVGSAGLYLSLPPQLASPFFTLFPEYVPTSMVQGTMPLSDYPLVAEAMVWVNGNMDRGGVLVVHQAFYGWARLYVSPDRHVIDSFLSSPSLSVGQVDTNSQILTVWWTPGTGWYGNVSPVGWKIIQSFGDIAVYEYR